jgi:hypothetical protein
MFVQRLNQGGGIIALFPGALIQINASRGAPRLAANAMPAKSMAGSTCTFTDKDGANIFMPYGGRNGRGTYQVTGGTGKFAGITGNGEFVVNMLGQIQSDDKKVRGFVSNKVTWKLPE